jgi:hypothetical protein
MMQKLVLSLAALAAVGVIVPCVAPAKAEETVVIKKHHRHFLPVERHHEGKTVIIKKHGGEDRD